jgi:hypothetical protein
VAPAQPAAVLPASASPAQAPLPAWGHPHGFHGAYGQMPSDSGASAWSHHAPPDVAGVKAAHEQTPFDILSFPAGLLPKLVKNALKCGASASPSMSAGIRGLMRHTLYA